VLEPAISVVGRRREISALRVALRNRSSRLILGPAGAGKTRIIQESLATVRLPFVLINRTVILHDLLVTLAERLECRSMRFPDLRSATSLHLKPLVLNTLRESPKCVILEDVEAVEPRMYRFLQEMYYVPEVCLLVTARSRAGIGHLAKLLWDPREEMTLEPLTHAESVRLFAEASRAFRLESLDLDDFRQKVIHAARGNPGQIIGMCRLAARADYRIGRRVKFAPLRIDLLTGSVR